MPNIDLAKLKITLLDNFETEFKNIKKTGILIDSWDQDSPSDPLLYCYKKNNIIWFLREDLGGIKFSNSNSNVDVYPANGIDRSLFKKLVVNDWLPRVYQYWGYQVIHASAVTHLDSSKVVTFVGSTGTGKSTFAYALGKRTGWQQINDDGVAFLPCQNSVKLLPIPNEIRLRPESTVYFNNSSSQVEKLNWPSNNLELKYIFYLDQTTKNIISFNIKKLDGANTYKLLLKEAYALSLSFQEKNIDLMKDYLSLSSLIPIYKISYKKDFKFLESLLDSIEDIFLN